MAACDILTMPRCHPHHWMNGEVPVWFPIDLEALLQTEFVVGWVVCILQKCRNMPVMPWLVGVRRHGRSARTSRRTCIVAGGTLPGP